MKNFSETVDCPKCGSADVSMRWWARGAPDVTLANGWHDAPLIFDEHLAVECSNCEYKYAMAPKEIDFVSVIGTAWTLTREDD